VLKTQTIKITTASEAVRLPGVGQRLALKIEEIVRTDRLCRLESARLDPSDAILKTFMNIYGVGLSQASLWMSQGHSSLSDLITNVPLSDNQRIGIEHYEDFLKRIPREEVSALGKIVKSTAPKMDPEVQVIIGGSYRRGAKDSGDIDFIITKPISTISVLNSFLKSLVKELFTKKFLVAALATPSSSSGSKWHGACILPPPAKLIWRRIDFLLVSSEELGAALIYFTGNDIFNRSIRLLAAKKGMRLNQRGLYRNVASGEKAKVGRGDLIEGRDERRIFKVLGVPWRTPEERVC
jgi:DNA polymerase IV